MLAKVAFLTLLSTLALAAQPADVKVKYFIFREECYDRFLNFDLDPDCVKFTISKGIGLGIILGSLAFKLPQISKMYLANSAKGVSQWSLYVENFGCICTFGNSKRLGMSLFTYGESGLIALQNIIIIMMIWSYEKNIFMMEKLAFLIAFFVASFVLIEGSLISTEVWDMISSAQIVIVALNRGP